MLFDVYLTDELAYRRNGDIDTDSIAYFVKRNEVAEASVDAMQVGGGGNNTQPKGVTAPIQLEKWQIRPKDVKRYLHFDRRMSSSKLQRIANDPNLVAIHPFYPLFLYHERWIRFRGTGRGAIKSRPIRYAARLDAAIYARYRVLLSGFYEKHLAQLGISDVPIAYRKIRKPDGGGNKSNIDFAKDIFDFVRSQHDVIVTVVDISSYFESLDHARIYEIWKRLIHGSLPADQMAIYNSITKYCTVDSAKVHERLEVYSRIGSGNRKKRRMQKIGELKEKGHLQIATPQEFRDVICGGNPRYPSLIQKNNRGFGIPQGTPISDLVANFYLIDFDKKMAQWAKSRQGIYFRYSDDIVMAVPTNNLSDDLEVMNLLKTEISLHGNRLKIKDKKVVVARFSGVSGSQSYTRLHGLASKYALDYLGFSYNGKVVSIKDATLSNAWRKVKRRSWGSAWRFVKQYREKGTPWLLANYPFFTLETKILRDTTLGQGGGFKKWTFIKYVRRASSAFGNYDRVFSSQTRKYRRRLQFIIDSDLRRAIEKYS